VHRPTPGRAEVKTKQLGGNTCPPDRPLSSPLE
jgi:hypothetical protein